MDLGPGEDDRRADEWAAMHAVDHDADGGGEWLCVRDARAQERQAQ
jgi:hypothetical protein